MTTQNNLLSKIYFISLIILLSACQSKEDKIIEQLKKGHVINHGITIDYPQNNTVLPPDITSPTFVWKDSNKNVDEWLITVEDKDRKQIFTFFSNEKKWKADSLQWELIKKRSIENEIKVSIMGIDNLSIISGSSVLISTSKDSVNARIFYRDIPLPFSYALKNLDKIRYRLADISKDEESKVMLEKLPICGNCHSFSADGKTIGMDVDYANDKGSYVISDIEEETPLTIDKIITWSDYKREDGEATFGLLSQISPDGRYVASMVKDRSIFIAKDDNIAYSQLFFPIRGIIVIYDRLTKKMFPLKGADDLKYCQANPNWSPDGKYLVFSRAKVYHSDKVEKYKTAVIPKEAAKEFLSGQKEYKYNLYKVPFNNGKGGKALPVEGASNNGKSNYFARISPDGKWIVFTQAENFMLLQPDSKLFIIPSKGGKARELNCNNSNMNSWHSWSPNSRWIVFSSKERGAYTQLYLTHIDENGNDTPPVLLESIILPKRAVNIPEFVNLKGMPWKKMIDIFSDSSNYPLRVAHNYLNYKNYPAAIKAFSSAIKKDPGDFRNWYSRGLAYQRSGMWQKALMDFKKASEIEPDVIETQEKLADIYVQLKKDKEAENIYKKVLLKNVQNAHAWYMLGVLQAKHKKYTVAIKSLTKAIKYQSDTQLEDKGYMVWYSRGLAYQRKGLFHKAINDYKKVLEHNSDCVDCMINLTSVYIQLNDYKNAKKMNDKAIYQTGSVAKQWFEIGINSIFLKQYQTAIDCFTTAIDIDPNDARSYYERGLLKIRIDQKNNGCLDLNKALELKYKKAEIALSKYCR